MEIFSSTIRHQKPILIYNKNILANTPTPLRITGKYLFLYSYSLVTPFTHWLACSSLNPRYEGSNPAEGNRFLMAIKSSKPSFGREIKPSPHVIRVYVMLKIPLKHE
jgi:hypothetical protein